MVGLAVGNLLKVGPKGPLTVLVTGSGGIRVRSGVCFFVAFLVGVFSQGQETLEILALQVFQCDLFLSRFGYYREPVGLRRLHCSPQVLCVWLIVLYVQRLNILLNVTVRNSRMRYSLCSAVEQIQTVAVHLQNCASFSDTAIFGSDLGWFLVHIGLPCNADSSKVVHIFCTIL